jgi:hypothetical protein
VITCGSEWESASRDERPMFWSTPVVDGVRFRVAQLIFKSNEEAMQYVKNYMPSRFNEALLAWQSL